jgi:hypothetical protein
VFALYATAVFTGMRAGELGGLRWDDVDFDKRLVTVQRSFDGPIKAGDIRYVPILDALLPVLRAWRLRCSSLTTKVLGRGKVGCGAGSSHEPSSARQSPRRPSEKMSDDREPARVPARVNVHLREVLRWSTRLRGVTTSVLPTHDGRPNPVVVGNRIYTVSFAPGIAWALDARTGDILWRRKLGRFAGPTPLVHGPLLFVKTSTELFCLQRSDGQVRWSYRPYETEGESVYSSPVVHGEHVIVADRRGTAHAVSIRTGRVRWTSDVGVGSSVNSTAADVAGTLVFGTNGREAVGVRAEDGAIRWRTRIDAPCIAAPRSIGTSVVMHTDTTVFWVRARDGHILAQWSSGGTRIRSFGTVGTRALVIAAEGDAGRLVVLSKGRATRELPHPGFAMSDGLRYEPNLDVVFDARIMALGILEPKTAARLVDIHGFGEPLGTPTSTRSRTFVAEGGRIHALDNKVVAEARARRSFVSPSGATEPSSCPRGLAWSRRPRGRAPGCPSTCRVAAARAGPAMCFRPP